MSRRLKPRARVVASGALRIDGRSIPCANLSDGMRVLLESPVPGFLDVIGEAAMNQIRVRFRDNGTERVGFSAAGIIQAMVDWADRFAPETATADERRIARDVVSLLTLLGLHGRRVVGIDAAPSKESLS